MKIITGMHRSGTSLVARLFFEAGGDLGDPTTFYRPDRWNPDGYYEQPEIHGLNMRLTQGWLWKLAYFWLPSTATIMKRAGRKAELIAALSAKYSGKIIKETRFCLTLPAWQRHGAHVEKVLVCLRDPGGVIHSLQRRNKISAAHAGELWLVHNRRLLENLNDLPVWFTYYGALLDPARCRGEMAAVFAFFDMPIAEAQLDSLAASFIKPGMNHGEGQAPAVSAEVEALWQQLLARHAAQGTAPAGATLTGT